MGIRGLSTYITENAETYLEPYELENCYLVIDGNAVLCCLFNAKVESFSAFGGDYDELYKVTKEFFILLQKCKVKSIVVFDGAHERKKIKTIIGRYEGKIPILKQLLRGFSTAPLFPLFFQKAFLEALDDLGIFYVRTDLEADLEVAAIARALNCPVLSSDSDFFIFDVLYIPFKFLNLECNKHDSTNNYFLKCLVYDVTKLLNAFSGLDKSLLPVLATVLGNDYIPSSLFNKFFAHVSVQKCKYKSYSQCKIEGLLRWLQSENVESAIKLILSHVSQKQKDAVLKSIQSGIKNYTSKTVSEFVINKLIPLTGNIGLIKTNFKINLPPELIQLYYNCKINAFVIDILTLGYYFAGLQVEIINKPSHIPSLELISHLVNILTPYLEDEIKSVKVFLITHTQYSAYNLEAYKSNCTDKLNLDSVIKENREVRLQWLCRVVDIDKNELNIVSCDNSWSIFILSFIYWLRKLGSELTHAHIHSLLIMAIVNEGAQKDVGYYRKISKFKKKSSLINKLKDTPIKMIEVGNFEDMLKNVTKYEKLLITKHLIPYRQVTEKEIGNYSVLPLHLFSCFQSILYHIMQINALLNFPLPNLRISDFYSGTLLYNFFLNTKKNGMFGYELFNDTPNLATIYKYLCDSLAKFFPKNFSPENEKPRKRNKKRKNTNRRL